MNAAPLAGLLAGLLLASGQAAVSPPQSTAGTADANAEHIESGQIRSADGTTVSYRIRLLPLSSFPALPDGVVTQLAHRGCMIPQTFEAKQPENVIQGAFHAPDATDWAVLCSVRGSTTLYVFLAGQFDQPMALRSQPDTAWLGADPGETVLGSAWGIATRTAQELRSEAAFRNLPSVDHDGIDDARLERSLTIHYFQDGKWVEVSAGNQEN